MYDVFISHAWEDKDAIARPLAEELRRQRLNVWYDELSLRLQDVPFAVVAHVRSSLRLPADTALDVTPRTLYRHHDQIRTHLQVTTWRPEARRATIAAVHEAAQVMDHPADLINVAIEELVRQVSADSQQTPSKSLYVSILCIVPDDDQSH